MVYGWIKRTGDHLSGEEVGANLVEYALLVALIAVVAFAAVAFVGDTLNVTFYETVPDAFP